MNGCETGRTIGPAERTWRRQSFAGADLYPGLIAKAAALGFSLIQNHPSVDGKKRIGHAALEITLVLKGMELDRQRSWGKPITRELTTIRAAG